MKKGKGIPPSLDAISRRAFIRHVGTNDDADAPGREPLDVIGTWIVVEAMRFDEDMNRKWMTKEEVMADDSIDEDAKEPFRYKLVFMEDGTQCTTMPIPEDVTQEEIDQAVAEGEIELFEEKYMALEKHLWKIEDGKLMIDTGMKGEVLGEEVSPWVEAPITDGIMEYMMFRLKRERFRILHPV